MSDTGKTLWRHMPCPACGQDMAWTVATKAEAKVACTNEVGERNHKKKCGFTMLRAEWDYVLERGETWSAREFVRKKLETFTRRKTSMRS